MNGMSPHDAMRAVLDDDARILGVLSSGKSVAAHGAAGDGGALYLGERSDAAVSLGSAISAEVYTRLRT